MTDPTPDLDERIPVAQALRRLRGERTQTSVAERAGIRPARWSAYEAGKHLPALEQRTALARGLGVSLLTLEQEIWHAWENQLLRFYPGDLMIQLQATLESVIALLTGLSERLDNRLSSPTSAEPDHG